MKLSLSIALPALLSFAAAASLELDIEDEASIKKAAASIANGLAQYHNFSAETSRPDLYGLLGTDDYLFRSTAISANHLLDYTILSGDQTHLSDTILLIQGQAGREDDFLNIYIVGDGITNEDLSAWALTAMTAAEYNIPQPANSTPWLTLATNVWAAQVARWDQKTCNGGLRWMLFDHLKGFEYKNAQSTLSFFELSARLGRYTGNETYTEWAIAAWEWLLEAELAVTSSNGDIAIFDGLSTNDCSAISKLQWSHNIGSAIAGMAALCNATADEQWGALLPSLITSAQKVFTKTDEEEGVENVLFESACESRSTCNLAQMGFKGELAADLWRAGTFATLDSEIITIIDGILKASAKQAVKACPIGGAVEEPNEGNGDPWPITISEDVPRCGHLWSTAEGEEYDGVANPMNQGNALAVVAGLLHGKVPRPGTAAAPAAGFVGDGGDGEGGDAVDESPSPVDGDGEATDGEGNEATPTGAAGVLKTSIGTMAVAAFLAALM